MALVTFSLLLIFLRLVATNYVDGYNYDEECEVGSILVTAVDQSTKMCRECHCDEDHDWICQVKQGNCKLFSTKENQLCRRQHAIFENECSICTCKEKRLICKTKPGVPGCKVIETRPTSTIRPTASIQTTVSDLDYKTYDDYVEYTTTPAPPPITTTTKRTITPAPPTITTTTEQDIDDSGDYTTPPTYLPDLFTTTTKRVKTTTVSDSDADDSGDYTTPPTYLPDLFTTTTKRTTTVSDLYSDDSDDYTTPPPHLYTETTKRTAWDSDSGEDSDDYTTPHYLLMTTSKRRGRKVTPYVDGIFDDSK